MKTAFFLKPLQSLRSLLLTGCLACSSHAAAQDALLVHTDDGPVRGVTQGRTLAWLGIPYAAPPTGALRWAPPQRPQAWAQPRDASTFGNACPQNADLGVFGKPGGDEDCLNLNVFVSQAARTSGKPLPVFVWLHGGSLWVGANRDYNASKLAIDGGAVVVVMNYRLGLLGWFAHPALKHQGHAIANYGHMDQQLALDWVQRNIAAFGGDPNNVTLSGESAGGGSVFAHMIAPGSAGKFQHAAAMSAAHVILKFPALGASKPLDWAEAQGRGFAQAVGCSTGDVPACLRALPVQTILAQQSPFLTSQVIVDGHVLPQHPNDALRSGQFHRVTLIHGTTRDEGTFFAGFPENESGQAMDEAGYVAAMQGFFGDQAATVMPQYPTHAYATPSEAYGAAVTDMLFACPAHAVNRWMSGQTPTYAYEFADRTAPSYLKPVTFALGAAHTFEVPYLFPGFHGGAGIPVALNPWQTKLADDMVTYWTHAARASEHHSQWPRYEPDQARMLSLALPQPRVIPAAAFSQTHHCDFWDTLGIY